MVVLLVLVTFLFFIALDYILNGRKAIHTVGVEVPAPSVRAGANYVDGFLVPESLSYHSGHSWLLRERRRSWAKSRRSSFQSPASGSGRGRR
jgi:glycine cleavage system H protein